MREHYCRVINKVDIDSLSSSPLPTLWLESLLFENERDEERLREILGVVRYASPLPPSLPSLHRATPTEKEKTIDDFHE